ERGRAGRLSFSHWITVIAHLAAQRLRLFPRGRHGYLLAPGADDDRAHLGAASVLEDEGSTAGGCDAQPEAGQRLVEQHGFLLSGGAQRLRHGPVREPHPHPPAERWPRTRSGLIGERTPVATRRRMSQDF